MSVFMYINCKIFTHPVSCVLYSIKNTNFRVSVLTNGALFIVMLWVFYLYHNIWYYGRRTVIFIFFASFFCCLQVSNNCMRKMSHHQSTKAYQYRDIAWSTAEEGSKFCHNATSLHNIISKKKITHVEQLTWSAYWAQFRGFDWDNLLRKETRFKKLDIRKKVTSN